MLTQLHMNGGTHAVLSPCAVVDCGQPEDVTDGMVVVPSTTFGSTVTYSCDLGYRLVGLAARTCGADGQWSNGVPFCIGTTADTYIHKPRGGMFDNRNWLLHYFSRYNMPLCTH